MKTIKKVAVILTVLGAVIFTVNGFSNLNLLSERTIGIDFLKILIALSSIFVIIAEFTNKKS